MRHRLITRAAALAVASAVALPAAAHAQQSSNGPGAAGEPAACESARIAVSAETIPEARSATLCLLNRERSSRGLPRLRLDAELGRAALAHSRDMVRRTYFEHETPDGRDPFERMLATAFVPDGARWRLGENLGWGTLRLAQPAAVMRAWMGSPAHRRNILDGRFRAVGIGIVPGIPVDDPQLDAQSGATYTTDFGAWS